MCNLICMAFDGDYVTEGRGFESVDDAWERSDDMGSRWFFYPFHFVTTASGRTIKDAPEELKQFKGRRVTTVSRIFKDTSELPEAQEAEPPEFCDLLPLEIR